MSFNLAELQNCSGSQWVSGILEGIELDPDSQDRFDDQPPGELGFFMGRLEVVFSHGFQQEGSPSQQSEHRILGSNQVVSKKMRVWTTCCIGKIVKGAVRSCIVQYKEMLAVLRLASCSRCMVRFFWPLTIYCKCCPMFWWIIHTLSSFFGLMHKLTPLLPKDQKTHPKAQVLLVSCLSSSDPICEISREPLTTHRFYST